MMRLGTVDELVAAIVGLAVRGAPALGIVGAFGVAVSAFHNPTDPDQIRIDADRIANARPTAVNLAWGVARALAKLPDGPDAVLAEADPEPADTSEVLRSVLTRLGRNR